LEEHSERDELASDMISRGLASGRGGRFRGMSQDEGAAVRRDALRGHVAAKEPRERP
jgi:hypothetical protein